MRLMRGLLCAAVLCLGGSAAVAADIVALEADATWPTSVPGGFNEGACTVVNLTHGDVRVRLTVLVTYADGSVTRLTNLGPSIFLGPDMAFQLNVLFIVPSDAALGTATFQCEAMALPLTDRGRPEREVARATFEVISP